MRRIEEKAGKWARRLHPERQTCPRGGNPAAAKAILSRRQAKRGGKDCWNAEQLDPHVRSSWRTSIASQPLFPREPIMGALRTRKGRRRSRRVSLARLFHLHLNPL